MLKQHFYYSIMRKTIVQTMSLFDDIVIARYDMESGKVLKYIKVPLKFAPKTKRFYMMEKRLSDGDIKREKIVPMMAMELTNIAFDPQRMADRNTKIPVKSTTDDTRFFFNPIPYNFDFQLDIVAEYNIDIVQIVEQILPFFSPCAFVRITVPELNIEVQEETKAVGTEPLEIKINYTGSQKDHSVDIGDSDNPLQKWSMNFVANGYLFTPSIDIKQIKNMNIRWFMDYQNYTDSQYGTEPASYHIDCIQNPLTDESLLELQKTVTPPWCCYVMDDQRRHKNDPPEMSDHGTSGQDRNDRDLSRHIVCWDGTRWWDRGIAACINPQIGDVCDIVYDTNLHLGMAGKGDFLQGDYDEDTKKIIEYTEKYA